MSAIQECDGWRRNSLAPQRTQGVSKVISRWSKKINHTNSLDLKVTKIYKG
jgi:hypothetical protein